MVTAEPHDRFASALGRLVRSVHLTRILLLLGTLLSVDSVSLGTLLGLVLLSLHSLAAILVTVIREVVIRRPWLAMLDALVCVLLVISSGGAPATTFVALATAAVVGVSLPLRLAAPVVVVLVTCVLAPVVLAPQELGPWRGALIVGAPVVAVGLALVGAVSRWSLEQARAAETQALVAERARVAAEHQAQLARDLHDGAGKSLHGIGLLSAALVNEADKEGGSRTRMLAEQIGAAADTTASEVRSILSGLRIGTSDLPLASLLHGMAEEVEQRSGIPVSVTATAPVDLSPEVRREVWLATRELMHNAVKHAKASRIDVTFGLMPEEQALRVRVSDDGAGMNQARVDAAGRRGHYGLQGVRERLSKVGGSVTIDTTTGQGTTITMEVPLD